MGEPTEHQTEGAVRAEVSGIPMPPQEMLPDGVLVLEDPYLDAIVRVAGAMGLEPVGWAVTTLPRTDDKHGEVFLSGSELRQAARFQERFGNRHGHSKFVTMVIQCEISLLFELTLQIMQKDKLNQSVTWFQIKEVCILLTYR